MTKQYVEADSSGTLSPQDVPTGAKHVFVARRLVLDHRYHDDDPVQEADFTARFANGFELKGKLDEKGKATLIGVPEAVTVRFGPDAREFQRVDNRENPDHREEFSDSDFEALYQKYQR